METCQARFTLKNPNSKTTDASFGGSIQIHRIRFVNSFCSSIEIRIKTENGFKRVTCITFGRHSRGFNKTHLIEFKPPLNGSLLRFIVTPIDAFYGDGGVSNLKVFRSSAIPQKSLLAALSAGPILNGDSWKLLQQIYEP